MATKTLPQDTSVVTISDIAATAERAQRAMVALRDLMLNPDSRKKAPKVTSVQLMNMCGLARHQFAYRLSLGDLPQGTQLSAGRTREFTLAEARHWIKASGKYPSRAPGQTASTICVSNFKGGTGKTSTAMCLGQGLSLRGLKVLLIDLDPQGSLTTLNGIIPDLEVSEEQTVAPVCHGETLDLRPSVRDTYWDGISLIPASPSLYAAEFVLPARQQNSTHFKFWDVINDAIESIRGEYDVIIIDTPPSMSYLTLNAIMAADILLLPIPPQMLDYASMAQFWNLFSDLALSLQERREFDKTFDAVHIMLSKVGSHSTTPTTRRWISETYGGMVMTSEIPETTVVTGSSAELSTVYDITKYSGDARTYARARDAYDRMIDLLLPSVVKTWARTGAERSASKEQETHAISTK